MDRKTRRLNDVDGQPSQKKRGEKRIGAEGKIWASVDKISVKAPFRERGGRRRRHRRVFTRRLSHQNCAHTRCNTRVTGIKGISGGK